MKKWITLLLLSSLLVMPVSATEFQAPTAPASAQLYMPRENETFAQGLWYILKSAISQLHPELSNAAEICFSITITVFLISILNSFSSNAASIVQLTGTIIIGVLFIEPANTLIRLGATTVTELSEYGKLLLPVMTAALAAQGGTTSSAAIYTGTVFFDTILTTMIIKIVVPLLYIYLCVSLAGCASGQDLLKKVRDFIKWLMTWSIKLTLYIFSGYMSITGTISGVVDASALKATKLAISGMVPVVGGILSDASETILVSTGIMKNAAGVYGIFAVLALCVSPFLKIGIQYLLLKFTSAVCNIFGLKSFVELIRDLSAGMGLILAMTGTVCVLQLISLVCFMKGIG